ncbi:hypothetical protein FDK38_005453 [Candidozyma auris]|nr:hypothetical protein FDK38_005453 [[Candida] auris]
MSRILPLSSALYKGVSGSGQPAKPLKLVFSVLFLALSLAELQTLLRKSRVHLPFDESPFTFYLKSVYSCFAFFAWRMGNFYSLKRIFTIGIAIYVLSFVVEVLSVQHSCFVASATLITQALGAHMALISMFRFIIWNRPSWGLFAQTMAFVCFDVSDFFASTTEWIIVEGAILPVYVVVCCLDSVFFLSGVKPSRTIIHRRWENHVIGITGLCATRVIPYEFPAYFKRGSLAYDIIISLNVLFFFVSIWDSRRRSYLVDGETTGPYPQKPVVIRRRWTS